jgi:hypothetical protein
MVEQVDPRLIKLVMERDQERAERIRMTHVATGLRNLNTQLNRRIRQLTRDHAMAINRATRTEHRKP